MGGARKLSAVEIVPWALLFFRPRSAEEELEVVQFPPAQIGSCESPFAARRRGESLRRGGGHLGTDCGSERNVAGLGGAG